MIIVTYQYPTAYGNMVTSSYGCETSEEAERVCKTIEECVDLGYKIVDVTRE